MPLRARAWIFVINNYTDEDISEIMNLCRYKFGTKGVFLICGYEVGENGTPHIQGYVYFRCARTRRAISGDLSRAHLEPAKGTPEDNVRYIVGPYKDVKTGKTKDVNPDVFIFGKQPRQGRASYDKVQEAMQDPKNHIQTFTQYRKAYKEIQVMEPPAYKERIVSRCPSEDKYQTAKRFTHNGMVCFYDGSNYNGEAVVFIPMSCQRELPVKWRKIEDRYYDMIQQWLNGFPPVIRNGYELIRFDPNLIYVLCDDQDLYDVKFPQ